jgi:glycosyltransferase involved in cell wall biosynthesis
MPLRFSIITCTWNSEPYLAESIASVLAQDYPEIEYIFVDGGSTDGTIERIRSLERPYKFVTDIRGGISNAMNEGIRMATGDIVAHLHSDDYFATPRVLSDVAAIMADGGAGWLFGKALFVVDGQARPANWAMPRYSYPRLLKGNFIAHQATFVRRDLMLRAGMFDTNLKYAMDYDLWLKLGRLAEPVQVDDYLCAFREHAGSLSTANRLLAMDEDFRVRMRHAGRTPWSWFYHGGHYIVRRLREARALRARASGEGRN